MPTLKNIEKMERIDFHVPVDISRKVGEIAKTERTGKSAVLRRIVCQYFDGST